MKPSSRIVWFIETRGVTLCSHDKRLNLSIPYPYAGLWALIANGNYRKDYAVELMSHLLLADRNRAEREVEETLDDWIRAGLLSRE
jgi:hypothetical protein